MDSLLYGTSDLGGMEPLDIRHTYQPVDKIKEIIMHVREFCMDTTSAFLLRLLQRRRWKNYLAHQGLWYLLCPSQLVFYWSSCTSQTRSIRICHGRYIIDNTKHSLFHKIIQIQAFLYNGCFVCSHSRINLFENGGFTWSLQRYECRRLLVRLVCIQS